MEWSGQQVAGGIAALAALIAVTAGVIDWRERRRVNLDRVSLLDWRSIQLFALGIAITAAALAIH